MDLEKWRAQKFVPHPIATNIRAVVRDIIFQFRYLSRVPLISTINDDIPENLSRIVLKLMAKNAEDRYQSAFGLKQDLETSRMKTLGFYIAHTD